MRANSSRREPFVCADRTIAKIEPEWIETVGAHLLKKSMSDAHWEKKAAQVVAFERATLYGLTVYARRRVSYGKQDPKYARDLFIRGALVEGEFDTRLPFFAHNRKLVADIEQLEHKRAVRTCSWTTNSSSASTCDALRRHLDCRGVRALIS